jgi:hypothetical protein
MEGLPRPEKVKKGSSLGVPQGSCCIHCQAQSHYVNRHALSTYRILAQGETLHEFWRQDGDHTLAGRSNPPHRQGTWSTGGSNVPHIRSGAPEC